MRSFVPAVIFQALAALLAVTQVGAGPLPIQQRSTLDVYDPEILQPTAASVWQAGAVELVSWDTSDAPSQISNAGHVFLKTVPADPSQSQWTHLAGPFNLLIGQINVTVPNDVNSGAYQVVLFGDSGNDSPTFQVDGVSPSVDQQPPNDNDDPSAPAGNSPTSNSIL